MSVSPRNESRSLHSRKGFSTVLGTVIAVGILVTAVVPLIMYMQSTAALYDHSVAQRHIADEEKMDEMLWSDVYEDFYYETHEIMVKVYNPCELTVDVVRIWVISRDDPTNPTLIQGGALPLRLPPRGYQVEVGTGVIAQKGVWYDIKVVTERGNIYIPSGSPLIGGQSSKFPHTLTVTLINMEKGKEYVLDLEAIGTGGWVPVYLPTTLIWKATAENQFQSLGFGVNPGTYNVSITGPGWSDWAEVIVTPGVSGAPAVIWDCAIP